MKKVEFPRISNRPRHYLKRANKKAKERSTTFYLTGEVLNIMRAIADFEGVSLSIIVERSLNYEKNGDFKKANRIKKKTAFYAKKKRKFANTPSKQKKEADAKSLFDL